MGFFLEWRRAWDVSQLNNWHAESTKRTRMSVIWGRAEGKGNTAEQPFLAEGVEEVPRVRILETMIQNPG
jgi:hypothetical protein